MCCASSRQLTAVAFVSPSASLEMIGAIFVPAGLYMAVQEALEATVTADMVSPEVRAVSYRVLGTVNGTASWRFWVCSPNVALQFFAQKYGFVFPIGTLVVNILGCLIIGAFTGITRPDGGLLVHRDSPRRNDRIS
jgi:hypothetical protein